MAVPKEMDCSRIPSFLTAATATFSAGEEIGIYTSIFAIYSGFPTILRFHCGF
jgi:hypothetical protein